MDSEVSTLFGVKVLIVDDESDALEFTKLMLTLNHACVIAAGNAADGLEQIRIHRPDVIVSDIGMPRVDGYQFIREVRNLSARMGGQTPAVALTAFNRAEDKVRAINAGFQKHLAKPFELRVLIDVIASMTGKNKLLSG
ncbi:MAG: response regulator [Nitrosospira sp.]